MSTQDQDDLLRRKVTRATFATRLAVLAAVLFMVTTVVAVVSISSDTNQIVTKVSDKQNTNAPLLESIEELAKEIRSCTDPKGKCAREGQERSGAAIASINLYGLYVVACADEPGQQTEVELRVCATQLMAERKP